MPKHPGGWNTISYNDLKKCLRYNKETGVFTWNVDRSNKTKEGDIAGTLNNGYVFIGIKGVVHRAHRLAWLYEYGYLPENQIDHIDRNRSNNKITNLREVSNQCNTINAPVPVNNKTGIKGVHYDAKRDKYRSQIKVFGKYIFLGRYKSLLNAAKSRFEAEVKYGFVKCVSDSSAYEFINKKCDIYG